MKFRLNVFLIVRRLLAAVSLLAMTAVFFVPAAARWAGWLPRLQLVPAILAGAVLEIVVLAVLVLLFGRLYCSVLCPLGIVQDLFRFCFGWVGRVTRWVHFSETHQTRISGKCAHGGVGAAKRISGKCAHGRGAFLIRCAILVLFLLAVGFGCTGLIEPYGIFGRFLSVGVRRLGEPATVTLAWAVGLFALILLLTLFRARFWCNRICPVGTFLGLFSRFALFRVRIDAGACVKCGACAKRCDKGALAVRGDRSVAVDASSCVACGGCLSACPKGALSFFRIG